MRNTGAKFLNAKLDDLTIVDNVLTFAKGQTNLLQHGNWQPHSRGAKLVRHSAHAGREAAIGMHTRAKSEVQLRP